MSSNKTDVTHSPHLHHISLLHGRGQQRLGLLRGTGLREVVLIVAVVVLVIVAVVVPFLAVGADVACAYCMKSYKNAKLAQHSCLSSTASAPLAPRNGTVIWEAVLVLVVVLAIIFVVVIVVVLTWRRC